MATVGIRELRLRASDLLRRVAAGETLEVTDRGRRVALLVPPRRGSPIEELRASGAIEPAARDLDDLPEPLVLARRQAPSRVLARLRQHER